jgi:hypothetical protein
MRPFRFRHYNNIYHHRTGRMGKKKSKKKLRVTHARGHILADHAK